LLIKKYFILSFWFNKTDFHLCSIYQFLQFSKHITFSLKSKIFCLSLPMHAFATFSKAIVPTKLVVINCSKKGKKKSKTQIKSHWHLKLHNLMKNSHRFLFILNKFFVFFNRWLKWRIIGSFRPKLNFWDLHQNSNFTKLKKMTANESLLDSCRTVITSQGISLHYNAQDNTAISWTFRSFFKKKLF